MVIYLPVRVLSPVKVVRRPADADVREGRPDIETILQAFEARVSCDLAGGDAAPLEMKCHPSPCHTLVSGPAGLVREVTQAACSRGHVVHAVSFAECDPGGGCGNAHACEHGTLG